MANYNIVNIAALHPISTLDEKDETHNINGKAVGDYVGDRYATKAEIDELRELIANAAKIVQINDESEIPANPDKNTLYVIPEDSAMMARVANVSEIDVLKAKFAALQSYVDNNFARIDYIENNFVQKADNELDVIEDKKSHDLTVQDVEVV